MICMRVLLLLFILASCSHGKMPISETYEDHGLLMCSYVLKPQKNGNRGYEFVYKKFAWKDWNWKNESQYIKLDHDSIKRVLILGKSRDGGKPSRLISSVYFVNYSSKENSSFWKDFDSQNNMSKNASHIDDLYVDGWSTLGHDYTNMTDVGLQRLYDKSNCGVSCIRYFVVKDEKDAEELTDQCRKQIKVFEHESPGAAFVHLENID
jgi:hypothetical protein